MSSTRTTAPSSGDPTRAAAAPASALRAFHAVATHGSFTVAARALGVSQPAVSMQVRALEETYGVELLVRTRKGAAPSELGRALLELTSSLSTLETAASELLARAGDLVLGQLRVGADTPFVAVPLLAAFRARHPEVELSLVLGNSAEVLRALCEVRTDVAVLSDRVQDARLVAIPAARSRQVVLVSRDHPWARRKSLRLRDLHGAPVLMREQGSVTRSAFELALAGAGVRPAVIMELGSREAVAEAVAAGLGAAAVIESERGHDERVVALSLRDATIEHTQYVVCLAERRRLRAVKAFLAVVPRLVPRGRVGR